MAKVSERAPNGTVILNSASATSNDYGITVVSAPDGTTVEVQGAVAGATTSAPAVAGTSVSATPVTAKTGSASMAFGILSALLGSGGLTVIGRKLVA